MTNSDALDRLRAADPVPEMPPVSPVVEIVCRLPQPPSDRHRPRRRAATLLGGAALLAVAISFLVISTGSPPTNVVSAAYAAVARNDGVVYAVFDTHAAGSKAAIRQEQWVDAAHHAEREVVLFGKHVTERVAIGNRGESWSNDAPGRVIVESGTNAHLGIAFGGLSLYGLGGVELFRQLYRAHRVVLTGHERRSNQTLWRLETTGDQFAGTKARLVVLVSPKSYLPVVQSVEDLSDPEHAKVLSESRVLRYEHRDGTLLERALNLRLRHPTARAEQTEGPVFRSGRLAETTHPGP